MLCFVIVVFWTSDPSRVIAQPHVRATAKCLHAEFRVDENASSGTVVGTLMDRYPDLTNFRLAPDSEVQPFAVNPVSGQIVTVDGTALDYESQTLHSFSVYADQYVHTEDRFLQQFAGSLLEEGISTDRLNELLISTETISVRIRLRNIPDDLPVSDLTTPIENTLEVPVIAGKEVVPGVNAETSITLAVVDDLVVSESDAVEPDAVEPDAVEPDAVEPDAVEQPAGEPSLVEFSKSETVVEAGQGEKAEIVLPVLDKGPIVSSGVRYLGALALVISVTGILLYGMYFNALKCRRRALKKKQMDSEDAECLSPDSAKIQDHSEQIPEETRLRLDSDSDDSDPVIHRESELFKSQIEESKEIIKQLRQEIEERDARIDDLKEKLEAVILRLEERDSRQRVEPDFRSVDRYGASGSTDDSAEDLWYDTSCDESTDSKLDFDNDPRNSLVRARGDLEQTLDRLVDEPSQRATGFGIKETFRDADSALSTDRNSREISGDSVTASIAFEEPGVAIAEPEMTLNDRTEQYHSADDAKSSEESHLDSVAQYLSNLLSRSNKGAAEETSQADRRSSAGRTVSIEDGRAAKRSQPVKSYIETYLNEHGGQLHQDLCELQQLQTASVSNVPAPVPVVRAPVDVQTIREHMDSFREVASQSVENALASYSWRQARGKLAWRTILVLTLIIMTVVVVVTNTATTIRFAPLNWLMEAIVLLTVAELFLRVQSIRRQQKLLQKGAMEQKRHPHSRDFEIADEGAVEADDATVAIR